MRYLDPKAYLTFKKIFGEHKDLLISLLNALLPLADDEQIESVEYICRPNLCQTLTWARTALWMLGVVT